MNILSLRQYWGTYIFSTEIPFRILHTWLIAQEISDIFVWTVDPDSSLRGFNPVFGPYNDPHPVSQNVSPPLYRDFKDKRPLLRVTLVYKKDKCGENRRNVFIVTLLYKVIHVGKTQ